MHSELAQMEPQAHKQGVREAQVRMVRDIKACQYAQGPDKTKFPELVAKRFLTSFSLWKQGKTWVVRYILQSCRCHAGLNKKKKHLEIFDNNQL